MLLGVVLAALLFAPLLWVFRPWGRANPGDATESDKGAGSPPGAAGAVRGKAADTAGETSSLGTSGTSGTSAPPSATASAISSGAAKITALAHSFGTSLKSRWKGNDPGVQTQGVWFDKSRIPREAPRPTASPATTPC